MDDTIKSIYEYAVERGDVDACFAMLRSKKYGETLRAMLLTNKWLKTVRRKGQSILIFGKAIYGESRTRGRWDFFCKPKKTKVVRKKNTNNRHQGAARLKADFKRRFSIKGFGICCVLKHGKLPGHYTVAGHKSIEPAFVSKNRQPVHAANEGCDVCGEPETWETTTRCSMRRYIWCNRIRRNPIVTEVIAKEYTGDTIVTEEEIRACRSIIGVCDSGQNNFVYPSVLPCYKDCLWEIDVAAPVVYRKRYKTRQSPL